MIEKWEDNKGRKRERERESREKREPIRFVRVLLEIM